MLLGCGLRSRVSPPHATRAPARLAPTHALAASPTVRCACGSPLVYYACCAYHRVCGRLPPRTWVLARLRPARYTWVGFTPPRFGWFAFCLCNVRAGHTLKHALAALSFRQARTPYGSFTHTRFTAFAPLHSAHRRYYLHDAPAAVSLRFATTALPRLPASCLPAYRIYRTSARSFCRARQHRIFLACAHYLLPLYGLPSFTHLHMDLRTRSLRFVTLMILFMFCLIFSNKISTNTVFPTTKKKK